MGTDAGGPVWQWPWGGSPRISPRPRCRVLMKTVELEREECPLNTASSCEASLSTMALFDPGLVSSSRFRSRMLTHSPPPLAATCKPIDSTVSPGTDIAVVPPVWTQSSLEISQQWRCPSGGADRKLCSLLWPIRPALCYTARSPSYAFCLSLVFSMGFFKTHVFVFEQKAVTYHLHHRCLFVYIAHKLHGSILFPNDSVNSPLFPNSKSKWCWDNRAAPGNL